MSGQIPSNRSATGGSTTSSLASSGRNSNHTSNNHTSSDIQTSSNSAASPSTPASSTQRSPAVGPGRSFFHATAGLAGRNRLPSYARHAPILVTPNSSNNPQNYNAVNPPLYTSTGQSPDYNRDPNAPVRYSIRKYNNTTTSTSVVPPRISTRPVGGESRDNGTANRAQTNATTMMGVSVGASSNQNYSDRRGGNLDFSETGNPGRNNY